MKEGKKDIRRDDGAWMKEGGRERTEERRREKPIFLPLSSPSSVEERRNEIDSSC